MLESREDELQGLREVDASSRKQLGVSPKANIGTSAFDLDEVTKMKATMLGYAAEKEAVEFEAKKKSIQAENRYKRDKKKLESGGVTSKELSKMSPKEFEPGFYEKLMLDMKSDEEVKKELDSRLVEEMTNQKLIAKLGPDAIVDAESTTQMQKSLK